MLLQILAALFAVLLTAPVEIAARADLNAAPSYQLEVHFYGLRFAFGGPVKARGQKPKKTGHGFPLRRAAARAALGLARKAPARMMICGRVGTGEADKTALCAAAIQTVAAALRPFAPTAARIRPDFCRTVFCLSARCMLSVRGGDIIRAGATAFFREIRAARREKEHGKQTH